MTLSPSDSPDWTGIQGGMRYLGPIHLAGNNAQVIVDMAFTPTSYDGAIYVLMDPTGSGSSFPIYIAVQDNDVAPALITWQGNLHPNDPPTVAFVARVLGSDWHVVAEADFRGSVGAVSVDLYVFAVPSFPSVVPAQNLNGLKVNIAAATLGVGVPGRGAPYDSMLVHIPAAATQAVVQFIGSGTVRWVVDLVVWTYRNNAAVASTQFVQILDGATTAYAAELVLPAVVNSVDRLQLGPASGIVGSPGQTVTVNFGAAGPANTLQRVSAAAYLLA